MKTCTTLVLDMRNTATRINRDELDHENRIEASQKFRIRLKVTEWYLNAYSILSPDSTIN